MFLYNFAHQSINVYMCYIDIFPIIWIVHPNSLQLHEIVVKINFTD